jgi:hypothetical protein
MVPHSEAQPAEYLKDWLVSSTYLQTMIGASHQE